MKRKQPATPAAGETAVDPTRPPGGRRRTKAATESSERAAQGDALPLPHESDESLGSVKPETDARIEQARKDLAAGQVDTDLRGTPGLDAENRARILRRGRR
jgi:hypothetical protein